MKVYETHEIRNFALLGSHGSGKTALAEAMLFEGGVIGRRGNIAEGTTVSDYHKIERENQTSVFSTVLYTEYLGKKINFIDCPGSADFIGSVFPAFRVTAASLMLVNAEVGVEVGTELLWRQTEQAHAPVMFVVNRLGSDKTNFQQTIDEIRESFGNKAVLVQYPYNPGPGFDAIIDVLTMRMYRWKPEGGKSQEFDIPADAREMAETLHNQLVEAAAENDENLMELFFEEGTLNAEQMRKGITEGLVRRDLFPIFCVDSERDMGVRKLMRFIEDLAPAPDAMKPATTLDGTEVPCSDQGPAAIFTFKDSVERHVGEVLYFKVLSGVVEEGMDLVNNNNGNKERLSQLYCVAGKERVKVDKLHAGDIGATVKLKSTKASHTLTSKEVDWVFPAIEFPEPKHRVAIKAASESDDEKMGEILHRMHDEDPTIVLEYSKELKQIILHGQGEHHLNVVKWHLDNVYNIPVRFDKPKIPYRETLTRTALGDYRHRKQSGGAGQFAEVHLMVEPYEEGKPEPTSIKIGGATQKLSVRSTEVVELPWGGKLVVLNCIVGGVIDNRFIPAIQKGIMEKMENGPLTGSYARDIRVAVYDGKMHAVDSNEISFKIAGAKAFAQAFRDAGPKILEPIMNVEVFVPSDRMGDVMGDLQTRRGMIQGMDSQRRFEVIKAQVPMAEMDGYSTVLRSLSSGRAHYSMSFDSYQPVPFEVQESLIKEHFVEEEA